MGFEILGEISNIETFAIRSRKSYATSLEKRKTYIALRDAAAEKHGMTRIVGGSGEDYLYPKAFFRPIRLAASGEESGVGCGLAGAPVLRHIRVKMSVPR
jgi:hypothetical protein